MRHQQIHRSVAKMAFQVTQAIQEKAHEADAYALREVELQYPIEIQGEAGSTVQWAETSITFEEILYDAPAQRSSDNDEPQVWFGTVLDTPDPVFVNAHVSDWDINDSGHTTGVTVRIGVFDPGQDQDTATGKFFKGRVHLTVQGLGAPDDQDETEGDDGSEG